MEVLYFLKTVEQKQSALWQDFNEKRSLYIGYLLSKFHFYSFKIRIASKPKYPF